MLTLDYIREQFAKPELTDDEAGAIRDACEALANSILDQCEAELRSGQASDA
jgi:predicted DNA-binding transcriptional regulator YafY